MLSLVGTDEPSRQAVADASERFTAAGSQMEQATTAEQATLVTQTALEGLYYVRAARMAMGMDPGPELPTTPEQKRAGAVTEDRTVDVEGHSYSASRDPSSRTPHYYPGGVIAGRPVPRGWYSEPWWRPALIGGAWGLTSVLLFSSMFAGMAGIPAMDHSQSGDAGGEGDAAGSDPGGGDAAGADIGGADAGATDFGSSDFGSSDFGGGFDSF